MRFVTPASHCASNWQIRLKVWMELMRFLVTAGNTQEKIDTVRQWSNVFTGNTGFGIAKALAELGEVHLLTSNLQHIAEVQSTNSGAPRISASHFTSHADLRDKLAAKMLGPEKFDAVFMSAAVSDYRPVRVFAVLARTPDGQTPGNEQWIVQDVQAAKVKSNHAAIAVLGEQTEKLVDLFRGSWGYKGMLVKFKLEVSISHEELIKIGQKSRLASHAEFLVANTLDMVDGAAGGAFLLGDSIQEWIPRGQLPARLAQLVRDTL